MANINDLAIDTERLLITPLSLSQLLMYSSLDFLLEKDLNLKQYYRKIPAELCVTLFGHIIPYVSQHPKDLLYGTLWIMILKQEKLIVGDMGFKGAPTELGDLEIGYATYPDFENKGLMTEAVGALTSWALTQENVNCVLAETDKVNLKSQKVLFKNNFMPYAENENRYWWRRDKNSK